MRQVALKTVIDAFGMYAIEACLLSELPDVFSPKVFYSLKDEMVTRVAAESPETTIEREDLEKKLDTLERATRTLQRMKIYRIPGMAARNLVPHRHCVLQ